MSQKLEDRLHLYERDHPIRDDQELISALEAILEEQDELPVEDRDFDLISEATDAILHLSGYSNEQLSNLANKAISSVKTRITSPHESSSCGTTKPRHHAIIRWLVSIAIILSIATVAVFASPTNRLVFSEMTHRIFVSLIPKTLYHQDNIDLVVTTDAQTFDTFEELCTSSHNLLLLPFDLEKEFQNMEIICSNVGETYDISISFVYSDSPCLIVIKYPYKTNTNSTQYNEKIGERDVALYDCGDYWMDMWIDEQIVYQIESSNIDILKNLTKNMRLKP